MLDSAGARLLDANDLSADSVVLVDVTTIVTPDDTAALASAVVGSEQKIATRRTALEAHVALQSRLTAQRVTAAQIVAVDVAPGGRRAWVFHRLERQ